MPPNMTLIIGVLWLLTLAAGVVDHYKLTAGTSACKATSATAMATVAVAGEQAAQAQEVKLSVQTAANATIDKSTTEALQDAKIKSDERMRDINSGAVRLYIDAAPARATGCDKVPTTATAISLANGEPIELAQSARSTYQALKDAITADQLKIRGLQQYATEVCLKDAQ